MLDHQSLAVTPAVAREPEMAAHCLLGVPLAWVGGGGPVVGCPVTETALGGADIILELPTLPRLFVAPKTVNAVAGGASDW